MERILLYELSKIDIVDTSVNVIFKSKNNLDQTVNKMTVMQYSSFKFSIFLTNFDRSLAMLSSIQLTSNVVFKRLSPDSADSDRERRSNGK